VDFYIKLWLTAHQIYGGYARDKYFPLWLGYFEAHGVLITNRAEAIMKHRGRTMQERELL